MTLAHFILFPLAAVTVATAELTGARSRLLGTARLGVGIAVRQAAVLDTSLGISKQVHVSESVCDLKQLHLRVSLPVSVSVSRCTIFASSVLLEESICVLSACANTLTAIDPCVRLLTIYVRMHL